MQGEFGMLCEFIIVYLMPQIILREKTIVFVQTLAP